MLDKNKEYVTANGNKVVFNQDKIVELIERHGNPVSLKRRDTYKENYTEEAGYVHGVLVKILSNGKQIVLHELTWHKEDGRTERYSMLESLNYEGFNKDTISDFDVIGEYNIQAYTEYRKQKFTELELQKEHLVKAIKTFCIDHSTSSMSLNKEDTELKDLCIKIDKDINTLEKVNNSIANLYGADIIFFRHARRDILGELIYVDVFENKLKMNLQDVYIKDSINIKAKEIIMKILYGFNFK